MPLFGKRMRLEGKHALVTGGSTGIGFALARELVRAGAHITLLARTASKLKEAQSELQQIASSSGSNSTVAFQAADVTNADQVLKATLAAEQAQGPIDLLICNAGAAYPGYFHDQGVDVFESTMRLNYMGTVNSIKAVYDRMVARNTGHICIVSSAMGTMGFIGYCAYAPTKYAVRGLADCLRNELQGTGVSVSLAFPPDTNTPGFANENATKPPETKLISEGSSVFPPEKVAQTLLRGIVRGDYILPSPDLGLQLHNTAIKGMVPRSFPGVLLDMLLGFLLPIIHAVHSGIMDSIARKGAKERFKGLWAASAGAGVAGASGATGQLGSDSHRAQD